MSEARCETEQQRVEAVAEREADADALKAAAQAKHDTAVAARRGTTSSRWRAAHEAATHSREKEAEQIAAANATVTTKLVVDPKQQQRRPAIYGGDQACYFAVDGNIVQPDDDHAARGQWTCTHFGVLCCWSTVAWGIMRRNRGA